MAAMAQRHVGSSTTELGNVNKHQTTFTSARTCTLHSDVQCALVTELAPGVVSSYTKPIKTRCPGAEKERLELLICKLRGPPAQHKLR